jgi:hypothetical protein
MQSANVFYFVLLCLILYLNRRWHFGWFCLRCILLFSLSVLSSVISYHGFLTIRYSFDLVVHK